MLSKKNPFNREKDGRRTYLVFMFKNVSVYILHYLGQSADTSMSTLLFSTTLLSALTSTLQQQSTTNMMTRFD